MVGKRHGLLRQVETLDPRALLPRPTDVRREAGQFGIHLHATNARAATQSGIKDLNDGHDESPED
jgi:hypothetical protein